MKKTEQLIEWQNKFPVGGKARYLGVEWMVIVNEELDTFMGNNYFPALILARINKNDQYETVNLRRCLDLATV